MRLLQIFILSVLFAGIYSSGKPPPSPPKEISLTDLTELHDNCEAHNKKSGKSADDLKEGRKKLAGKIEKHLKEAKKSKLAEGANHNGGADKAKLPEGVSHEEIVEQCCHAITSAVTKAKSVKAVKEELDKEVENAKKAHEAGKKAPPKEKFAGLHLCQTVTCEKGKCEFDSNKAETLKKHMKNFVKDRQAKKDVKAKAKKEPKEE